MNLLDVSIVNIAIPSIQRDLHASYADVQWALAGYTLAYALVLITGGRLGDTFGRKRLFLIGVTGFTIMSALCGAAQSPGQLIAFRVVQGAMGAIMVPQVLAVIQVIFPPAERIKALAGFGVTAGLGTISGPLIGGLLIQHNLFGLGWRPIFLINVPVGIIAVVASAVLVRESRSPSPPKLDPVGVGLVTVALLLLLYPLVQGRQLGWPAWTFISMAASAPVFALFVWYERIKDRRDGSPLVPLRLFGERGFSAGMAIAVTFFMGIASFGLVLTLFLQLGLGFTPLHAGLTFLPFSVGVLISSGAAARLAPRFGRGVTMAGALIIAAGMAGIIATTHHYGVAVTTWELVPSLVGVGLGLGAVIAPLADIVLARVADAGRGLGVRGVQHRAPAGELDRHRADRRDLLRDHRQPVRPGRLRRRAGAALGRRGRRGPGQLRRADRGPVPRLPARPAGRRRPDGHPRVVPAQGGPGHHARHAARPRRGGRERGAARLRCLAGPHPVVPGRRVPAQLPAHVRPAPPGRPGGRRPGTGRRGHARGTGRGGHEPRIAEAPDPSRVCVTGTGPQRT